MKKLTMFWILLLMILLPGCAKVASSSVAGSSQVLIQDQEGSTAGNIAESSKEEMKDKEKKADVKSAGEDGFVAESEQAAENSESKTVKNELLLQDLFIPEDECLKNASFMTPDIMESVLKYYPDLKPVKSEEGEHGHFTYWKRDGIEYITWGYEGTDAAGIVTKYEDMDVVGLSIVSGCSFSCGLKPGMQERELIQYFPCMKEFDKVDDTYFRSLIMKDKMGPLQTTDYDYAYYYSRGASDEEVEKYHISRSIAYSVSAFIKDGVVCKIVLDSPTAG